MQWTGEELAAYAVVQRALAEKGPLPTLLPPPPPSPSPHPTPSPTSLPSLPAGPAPSRYFTPEEIAIKAHRATRLTPCTKIAQHPLGAVVEYPECGTHEQENILHQFRIDPNPATFVNPRDNIQYPLGSSGSSGGHPNRPCNFITPHGGHAPQKQRPDCTEIGHSCTLSALASIFANSTNRRRRQSMQFHRQSRTSPPLRATNNNAHNTSRERVQSSQGYLSKDVRLLLRSHACRMRILAKDG